MLQVQCDQKNLGLCDRFKNFFDRPEKVTRIAAIIIGLAIALFSLSFFPFPLSLAPAYVGLAIAFVGLYYLNQQE